VDAGVVRAAERAVMLAPWMYRIGFETADLSALNAWIGGCEVGDIVDNAQAVIEADLDRSIGTVTAAAQPACALHATHCRDCGDELIKARQPWGLCVPCKSIREQRDRLRAVGV